MDPLDEMIIACLQRDARRSFASIGAEVGLSSSAVKRRVDAMRRSGHIRGFTVLVDHEAGQRTTDAFLELFCPGRVRPDDIRRVLAPHPQVLEAYTVTGDADALVHLRTRSTDELEQVIEDIRNHRDADRTRSTIVLSTLVRWPRDLAPPA